MLLDSDSSGKILSERRCNVGDLPAVTILPTGNGEEFLHLERSSIKRIKKSLSHSFEGQVKKWRQAIRAAVKAKKSCKVKMIIGFTDSYDKSTVTTDDMIIKVVQ